MDTETAQDENSQTMQESEGPNESPIERNRSRSPAMRRSVSNERPSRAPLRDRERGDRDQRRGQPARSDDVVLRILITSREAGNIIGKGGANVKEIRAESNSSVVVSENVPGASERIVQVTGELEQVAKGVSLIAYKLNEEALADERRAPAKPEEIKNRSISLRLLLPNARMGAVIGKAGAKIKEIQDKSGAHATSTETPLPGSSERLFTLSGLVDSIHIAIYWIAHALQEADKERGGPPPNTTLYRPGMMSILPTDLLGRSGVGRGPNAAPLGRGRGADVAGSLTQQIWVPNELVGNIIGKGGRSINEVRQTSGAQIRIEEAQEGKNERLVTIQGTPAANQMALYLLYNRMEQERAKKAAMQ